MDDQPDAQEEHAEILGKPHAFAPCVIVDDVTWRSSLRVQPPNGMRLSCGAELERSQIKDYLRKRGAGSFRRLLGRSGLVAAGR